MELLLEGRCCLRLPTGLALIGGWRRRLPLRSVGGDGSNSAKQESEQDGFVELHGALQGARLKARRRLDGREGISVAGKNGQQSTMEWLTPDSRLLAAADAISARIRPAAAAGSAAAVIGRPTTMWLAPAATASPAVTTRSWSALASPAGRMPGVT